MNSIHAGHRERLKNKFIRGGVTALEEHELLELLLFYAIPQKDTNPIAHDLLNRFGSLKGVFDAELSLLAEVPGIGTHAATLLKLQSGLAKTYYTSGTKRVSLATIGAAGEYITRQLYDFQREIFAVLALDINLRLIGMSIVAEGELDSVQPSIKKIASYALDVNAAQILLAHNHPGGSARPSYADIQLTQKIVQTLHPLGIGVCDHIITAGQDFYSFHQHRQFSAQQPDEALAAAQYSNIAD